MGTCVISSPSVPVMGRRSGTVVASEALIVDVMYHENVSSNHSNAFLETYVRAIRQTGAYIRNVSRQTASKYGRSLSSS